MFSLNLPIMFNRSGYYGLAKWNGGPSLDPADHGTDLDDCLDDLGLSPLIVLKTGCIRSTDCRDRSPTKR